MKTILNECNSFTVKKIHLLTTKLCGRNCPNCCNIVCTSDIVPYVTDDELKRCEYLFLTGGEPFQFVQPSEIAKYYKNKYKNIQKVIVYTNAFECAEYIKRGGTFDYIDGVSMSIKIKKDLQAFEDTIINCDSLTAKECNRLYVFGNLFPNVNNGFKILKREWQSLEEYKPCPDSIFRKMW